MIITPCREKICSLPAIMPKTMKPWYLSMLTMVGHEVHAVCPGKRKERKYRPPSMILHGARTYSEKPGHLFELNYTFAEANLKNMMPLCIAGGRAPEYLRLTPRYRPSYIISIILINPLRLFCHGIQMRLLPTLY